MPSTLMLPCSPSQSPDLQTSPLLPASLHFTGIVIFNQLLPSRAVPVWRAILQGCGSKPGAGAFLKAFLPCPFPTAIHPKLVIASLKSDVQKVQLLRTGKV